MCRSVYWIETVSIGFHAVRPPDQCRTARFFELKFIALNHIEPVILKSRVSVLLDNHKWVNSYVPVHCIVGTPFFTKTCSHWLLKSPPDKSPAAARHHAAGVGVSHAFKERILATWVGNGGDIMAVFMGVAIDPGNPAPKAANIPEAKLR